MINTSEYVSTGHPDKLADFISCYLLDRYLEHDPAVRFAVECQIKDNYVTLGGEVTSCFAPADDDVRRWVSEAVYAVGYTPQYRDQWGAKNTIGSDSLVTAIHLGRQSPDISQGVDADGWGDQGIFWGMAENNPVTGYLPKDHWLACQLGKTLYGRRLGGIDIKTQVTTHDDRVSEVIVAIPLTSDASEQPIREVIASICGEGDYGVTVNGTGRFVTHGPAGDCGTTGRKLAVDFYGGACRIGGGSPWTKDPSKADLTLNIYARYAALKYLLENPDLRRVYCAIACCIGRAKVHLSILDERHSELWSCEHDLRPSEVIEMFKLRRPIYAKLCKEGLFQCQQS